MKKIYLILIIPLITSCAKYQKEYEDYNYLPNNSIRILKEDKQNVNLLINQDNTFYLLSLGVPKNTEEDIYSDYYVNLDTINENITINEIIIKKNDKIEININNYNFCIYIKKLDKDNYTSCDFLYLYNIPNDFYITLNNNIHILFYDSYTKFTYKFMYHLSFIWIDTYTIDNSSYLTLTIKDNNFTVTTDKIRGKTIHKKQKK